MRTLTKKLISLLPSNTRREKKKQVQMNLLGELNICPEMKQPEALLLSDDKKNRILKEIARSSWLDEKTLMKFEKWMFEMRYVCLPEQDPYNIKRSLIAKELCENKKYSLMLKKNQRLHAAERAKLIGYLKENLEGKGNRKKIQKELSDTFNLIIKDERDEKYKNTVWIKFINIIGQYGVGVSSEILSFVNESNYKTLSEYSRNYLNSVKNRGDKEELIRAKENVKQMYEYILNNIDAYDEHSYLWLSKYYRENRQFDEAEKILKDYFRIADKELAVISLGTLYEEQIKYLIRKDNNQPTDIVKKQIESINEKIETLYEESLDSLKERIENEDESIKMRNHRKTYVTIVSKAARFEKNIGNYDLSLDILNEVDDSYPEYYRVLIEKGLLFQCKGLKEKPNVYHDLDKSIKTLRQAYEVMEKERLCKDEKLISAKCILVPLAKSLYFKNSLDEAERVCKRILEIDENETNAKTLMNQIKKKRKQVA